MFIVNFNPVIVNLGILQIRWYSLPYIIGLIFLYFWLRHFRKIIGFNRDQLDNYVFYSSIGVIVGSRLFYFLFYDPMTLIYHPLEFFKVWHGGMAFHGGLIGFLVAILFFAKKYKVNIWKLFDLTSIVATFSLILGRIGNLINGELVGTPFNGLWCTVFVRFDSVCRHPYQIYAFLSHLILLSYLLFLIYRNRSRLDSYIGSKILSINFLIGYGALRIITDIWKLDNNIFFLKTGQWLSIFMIIAGIIILLYSRSPLKK